MLGALLAVLAQAATAAAIPASDFVIACQNSGGDTMWFAASGFNSTLRTFYEDTTIKSFTVSSFSENPAEGALSLVYLNDGGTEVARNILPFSSSWVRTKRLKFSVQGTTAPIHLCIRAR